MDKTTQDNRREQLRRFIEDADPFQLARLYYTAFARAIPDNVDPEVWAVLTQLVPVKQAETVQDWYEDAKQQRALAGRLEQENQELRRLLYPEPVISS